MRSFWKYPITNHPIHDSVRQGSLWLVLGDQSLVWITTFMISFCTVQDDFLLLLLLWWLWWLFTKGSSNALEMHLELSSIEIEGADRSRCDWRLGWCLISCILMRRYWQTKTPSKRCSSYRETLSYFRMFKVGELLIVVHLDTYHLVASTVDGANASHETCLTWACC